MNPVPLTPPGGCPAKYQRPTYVIDDIGQACAIAANGSAVPTLGIASPTYKCLQGRMESATMWLGIAGFCITAIMMQRRIKARPLRALRCPSAEAGIAVQSPAVCGVSPSVPSSLLLERKCNHASGGIICRLRFMHSMALPIDLLGHVQSTAA